MENIEKKNTSCRESLILKPLGESHSKKNMVNVAAWIATTPTNIQDAVSKGSKNAVGDIIPVRFATTIAIPVSIKGTLKSTWNKDKLELFVIKSFIKVQFYWMEHLLVPFMSITFPANQCFHIHSIYNTHTIVKK